MLKLDYTYQETPIIRDLLITIEANKKTLSIIPLPDSKDLSVLRRVSLLNSALYSARIEGNDLTIDSFETSSHNLKKLEVQNLLDTYTWISHQKTPIDTTLLKNIHLKAMQNLVSYAGHFRAEQSAIFDSSGSAIYLTPPPQDIPELLITWQNNFENRNIPIPIIAALTHFAFEKIHPFLDGNGRVGRLVSSYYLALHDYNLQGLLSFEKYLEENRSLYYHTLQNEGKDITSFVEFFLTAIAMTGDKLINELNKPKQQEHGLLPRRAEILSIIRDHHFVSFDFISRRFTSIPPSTLRYDLLSLAKAGYIQKLGNTKGALYQPK